MNVQNGAGMRVFDLMENGINSKQKMGTSF